MPRPSSLPRSALALTIAATCFTPPASAQLLSHRLDNGVVQARVSDSAGGRLLSFSLAGQPNFLLVDEKAGNPLAPVDAASGHVAYQGHEVWIGPQHAWWIHQDVHPARAAARAPWPPDPYLSLAQYTLMHRDSKRLELESPASPVSGVQLRKRFALVADKPNSLRLEADAINRSAAPAGRDIWFNTRVPAQTRAYVPVANPADIRIEPAGALDYQLGAGLLSLELPAPGQGARKGKLFIQPSAGWIAGFRDKQAFIIEFRRQPRAAIHPAQGQVELYQEVNPDAPAKGLLEMEVHAPYTVLAPGETMTAFELWTILPYDGPATRQAHAAFLRRHAAQLGLHGLEN